MSNHHHKKHPATSIHAAVNKVGLDDTAYNIHNNRMQRRLGIALQFSSEGIVGYVRGYVKDMEAKGAMA